MANNKFAHFFRPVHSFGSESEAIEAAETSQQDEIVEMRLRLQTCAEYSRQSMHGLTRCDGLADFRKEFSGPLNRAPHPKRGLV